MWFRQRAGPNLLSSMRDETRSRRDQAGESWRQENLSQEQVYSRARSAARGRFGYSGGVDLGNLSDGAGAGGFDSCSAIGCGADGGTETCGTRRVGLSAKGERAAVQRGGVERVPCLVQFRQAGRQGHRGRADQIADHTWRG